MTRIARIAALALVPLTLAACASNQTGYKAPAGAVIGGAVGAVAGSQFGNGTGQIVGTAIGTLIGAGVGYEAGKSLDRADETYNENQRRDDHHRSRYR